MAPPKVKLHKNSGKARPGPPKLQQTNENTTNTSEPQPNTSSSSSSTNSVTGLTTEQEEQFQCELYWCIKQLQSALSTNRLSNKQIQDHTKALNTLMSNASPMIKKRQVMRMSFGDYRAKMSEDEKKAKKLSIKVSVGKPSDKSMFIRKALSNSTGKDFKFNFPTPEKDSLETEGSKEENIIEREPALNCTTKNVVFIKSNNNFRFNFSHDDTENANNT